MRLRSVIVQTSRQEEGGGEGEGGGGGGEGGPRGRRAALLQKGRGRRPRRSGPRPEVVRCPPFKRTTYKGSTTATAVSRTNPCLGTGLSRGRATDAPKICFKNAGAPFEVPGAAIWGGVGRKRIQGALRKPFLRPGALVRTLRAGLVRLVARARAPPTPLNCGASPRPTPRTPTPRPDNRSRVGASDWPYGGSRGADVKAGSAPPSRHPRSAC